MTVLDRARSLAGMATCADELEWTDPPDTERAAYAGYIPIIVQELQRRPGQWAIVARYPTKGSAGNVADKFKHRGCEATMRQGVVYARWPEES